LCVGVFGFGAFSLSCYGCGKGWLASIAAGPDAGAVLAEAVRRYEAIEEVPRRIML
jgi:hypothetical protein